MSTVVPAALDEILETFEVLDDWDERYGYLIELGQNLPPMEECLKTPENKVEGCLSTVWLVTETSEEQGETVFQVVADSDSVIVRGLIALLLAVYSGKPAREILSRDVKALFAALGLQQHLSATRRNGLAAMTARIRAEAAGRL